MPVVDLSKVMNLADGFEIYKDLRDRLLTKYEKPSTGIPASDLATGVIPTIPVTDVQVNGSSVLQNGVANIPVLNNLAVPTYGIPKVAPFGGYGLYPDPSLTGDYKYSLTICKADDAAIKAGYHQYKPIVPYNQHTSIYYGLSKLAGVNLSGVLGLTVGTYPDNSKQAIQKMFGLDGLLGPYEMDSTADQAYAIGEPFIYNGKQYKATAVISIGDTITPGGNCDPVTVKDLYVKKTDYALNNGGYGLVKVTNGSYGVTRANDGYLMVSSATEALLKAGNTSNRPVVPNNQHISVFYGLSKLAGVDLANETVTVGTYPTASKEAILALIGANGNGLQILNGTLATNSASTQSIKSASNSYAPIVSGHIHDAAFFGLAKAAGADMASLSDVTVGQYPQAQKTAIQTMLGIEADVDLVETVSGGTPSITGLPNVRYICSDTVSTLSLTPPASGSMVVRFHSGSTATVLTVPNTVKFPAWFDYTDLDASTTYELIITDGVYGGVMSWAD